MIDYIKSEAVKKYIRENGIELDDRLKYALIIYRYMFQTLSDIEESLLELASETTDEQIKEQVPVWISNRHREFEVLKRNSGPFYYYTVKYWDDGDQLYGSYGSLELALEAGKLAAREYDLGEFDVEKEYLISSTEDFEKYEIGEDAPRGGRDLVMGRFTADGSLLFCTESESAQLEEIDDPIEERYYIIPHPFRRGDIVRNSYTPNDSREIFVILENEDDDMTVQKERKAVWEKTGGATWEHMNINVFTVDLDTGMIWDSDSQILPVNLEYYPVDKKTEDVGERVLLCISELLKGGMSSPQYIQNGLMKLREDYEESQRISLITGLKLKKSTTGWYT